MYNVEYCALIFFNMIIGLLEKYTVIVTYMTDTICNERLAI